MTEYWCILQKKFCTLYTLLYLKQMWIPFKIFNALYFSLKGKDFEDGEKKSWSFILYNKNHT